MLSSADLERLITEKRHEIEKEKTALGLTPLQPRLRDANDKENEATHQTKKQVRIADSKVLTDRNDSADNEEEVPERSSRDLEETIPPGLERYIRRYIGLPVMLKAGEYSPNNPLIRAERASGDVLLGLGEYERRRNTLRKLRQQQYREYLDQQAKKKQEAKEQAERERRERDEKERLRDEELERERRQLEQERSSPEQRRASVCYVPVAATNTSQKTKVDTGVQVGAGQPLSVAVQTDDVDLYQLSPSPKSQLTQAERELSPRTVLDARSTCSGERRRSYGDFDERSSSIVRRSNRDKLMSDLRHSYMPSIYDADAIQMRNVQAEKEAAERRQFYQQELKNQILEQQRIREERKTREKMLEQAEMRRLEEQLRMLRMAQEREVGKQHELTAAMKENTSEYNNKRHSLQKEIDLEHQRLLRATSQPSRTLKRNTVTSHSDTPHIDHPRDKRPPYSTNIPDNSIFNPNYDVDTYLRRNLNPPREFLRSRFEEAGCIEKTKHVRPENRFEERTKYDRADRFEVKTKYNRPEKYDEKTRDSEHIFDEGIKYVRPEVRYEEKTKYDNPENIFEDGRNYDRAENRFDERKYDRPVARLEKLRYDRQEKRYEDKTRHDRTEKRYEPSFLKRDMDDETPIPVLRHSPKLEAIDNNGSDISDAMKVVEDKWKVPAVQKKILRSLPNDEGKNVSILTQLGSIRRQLQLEQLKLDNMVTKSD